MTRNLNYYLRINLLKVTFKEESDYSMQVDQNGKKIKARDQTGDNSYNLELDDNCQWTMEDLSSQSIQLFKNALNWQYTPG